MKFNTAQLYSAITSILISCSNVEASIPHETQLGWDWLQAQITANGTLTNESSSLANSFQNQAEVIQALKLNTSIPLPASVSTNISNDVINVDVESLARKVLNLKAIGQPADAIITTLLTRQNPDGGFGNDEDFQSSPLDTSWALLALKSANFSGSVVDKAVAYLLNTALLDGSYGISSTESGDIYTTSYVLQAMQAFSQSYNLTTKINNAKNWLFSQQQSGNYGDTLNTVVASLALIKSTTDASIYQSAIQTLKLSQSPDGSWGNDPYLTALAATAILEANSGLSAAINIGVINGTLQDSNGLSLANISVTATINGQVFSTKTSANGAFRISGLPLGMATISISTPGYDNILTTAGIVDNKPIFIAPTLYVSNTTPNNVSILAHIIDSATGNSLPGVQLSAGTLTEVSNNLGLITISGLNVGNALFHLGLSGYGALDVSGSLLPGLNNFGDIKLTALSASNSLSGIVTDSSTGTVINGAFIAVVGSSINNTSDATGKFSLTNLSLGSLSIVVSAPGYNSQTLSVNLNTVGNSALNVALTKSVASQVSITKLTPNRLLFNAFDKAEMQVSLNNAGTQTIDVTVQGTILDTSGKSIAKIAAKPASGAVDAQNLPITLAANAAIDVPVDWFVKSTLPGNYQFLVSINDLGGKLLAESGQLLTIQPTTAIGGGVDLNPPLAQINSATPIHITANLANTGNQIIPAGQIKAEVVLSHIDPNGVPNKLVAQKSFVEGSPLNNPIGSIFDSAGNLYVINRNDPRIIKITPAGVSSVYATVSQALTPFLPIDFVFDKSGNILVLCTNHYIVKITPSGTQTVLSTGLYEQSNIEVDIADNIYVYVNYRGGLKTLYRYDATGKQTVLLSSGLNLPADAAFDASGNMFVTNYGDGSISKIDSLGRLTIFATGLNRPRGIALDYQGNLFIANNGANNIIKITPVGVQSVFATGLSGPYGLKISASGDLYVANNTNDSIAKISPTGQVVTFAQSVTTSPSAMRFDSAGNLFLAKSQTSLAKLDTSNKVSTVNGNFNGIQGIAAAANGDMYVSSMYAGTITKVSNNNATTAVSGLSYPYGVALDANNNLYVAENSANQITKIDSTGNKNVLAQSLVKRPIGVSSDTLGNQYYLDQGFIAKVDTHNVGSIAVQNVNNALTFCVLPNNAGFFTIENGVGKRYTANGNLTSSLSGFPTYLTALIGDSTGSVFLLDGPNKKIDKIGADGSRTTFATLSYYGSDMTVNGNGDFLVALLDGRIVKINASGQESNFSATNEYSSVLDMVADSTGKLFVAISGNKIKALNPSGQLINTIATEYTPKGIAINAQNQLVVAESDGIRYATYDGQGQFLTANYGILSPKDLVWTGTNVIFADSSGRIFSVDPLTPGQFPTLIDTLATDYLDWRNGVLYYSSGNKIYTRTPNGSKNVFYTDNTVGGTSSLAGVAVKANGDVSFVSVNDARVVTLNNIAQPIATYAGFSAPTNIELIGNDLFINNPSKTNILKFDINTGYSKVFTTGIKAIDLAVKNDELYAVTNALDRNSKYYSDIYKIATDNTLTKANSANIRLSTILFKGDTPFAIDDAYNSIYSQNNNTFSAYARGFGNITDMLLDKTDNTLYFADSGTASILRYANNALSIYTDVNSVYGLTQTSDKSLVAIGRAGLITKIDPNVNKKEFNTNSGPFDSIALNSNGSVFVTTGARNAVYQFDLPAPPVIPVKDTVVYSATQNLPVIANDQINIPLDFGFWTPEFGGDYTVNITPVSSTTRGQLSSSIHIGAHATGIISTDKSQLNPGDNVVNLKIAVNGADFTTIAKVDTDNIRQLPTSVIPRPTGLGFYPIQPQFDRDGNRYFVADNSLKKMLPNTQVQDLLNLQGLLKDDPLAIDDQENIYIASKGLNQLLKVTKTGQSTLILPLTVVPIDVTTDRLGNIFILYNKGILRIDGQTGASKDLGNSQLSSLSSFGDTPPLNIVSDAKNNIYVQNWGGIINKITPDGLVSNVIKPIDVEGATGAYPPTRYGILEGEGVNIAGDCADNLFFSSITQDATGYGEEHILWQLFAQTGLASQVLDGLNLKPQISDMDTIYYDYFSDSLIIQQDYGYPTFKLPVKCGAIDVDLHVTTPSGQTLSGFNIPPSNQVIQADGAVEYIWKMQEVTARGESVRFDTAFNALVAGDVKQVLTSAFLTFSNSFAPGEVKLPLDIPTLNVINPTALALTLDKTSYPANAAVNASATLSNVGAQSINGKVVFLLLDENNVQVGPNNSQAVTLPAGSSLGVSPTIPINTGGILAGNYKLVATFLDASGNTLSTAAASFVINPIDNNAPILSSLLSVDKLNYNPLDTISIIARVSNLSGNSILSNLTVKEMITDVVGNVVFSGQKTIAQLLPNQLSDAAFLYSLQYANNPGLYAVQQTVYNANGTLLDTKASQFNVLSTNDTGLGLTGTITVANTTPKSGENTSLAVKINNTGNAVFNSTPINLSIVDPITGSTVSAWQYAPTIAIGGEFNAASIWTANTVSAKSDYLLVLSITTNGKTLALAQTKISVLPKELPQNPIVLNVSHTTTHPDKLLVLLSCQHHESHYEGKVYTEENEDTTCVSHRKRLLDAVLTASGISHFITSDTAEFYSAFRSGTYNQYWISGGTAKLNNTLVKELREAINNGDGLLLDGIHDSREALLDEVLGVQFQGNLEHDQVNNLINLKGNLLPAINNVLTRGQAVRFKISTGVVEAQFSNRLACHDCKDSHDNKTLSPNPAIISNSYGRGHSVLMGFDLIDTLTYAGNVPEPWGAILPKVFTFMHSTNPYTYNAGALVSIKTSITNTTPTLSVNAAMTASLPVGAVLFETVPQASVDITTALKKQQK